MPPVHRGVLPVERGRDHGLRPDGRRCPGSIDRRHRHCDRPHPPVGLRDTIDDRNRLRRRSAPRASRWTRPRRAAGLVARTVANARLPRRSHCDASTAAPTRSRGIRTELYPYHRWDLALRASEIAKVVACAPRPLTRRVDPGPVLSNLECVRRGRQVLNEHLLRSGINGLAEATPTDGEFRVRPVMSVSPSVSVVVPSPADQHLTLPAQLARLEHLIAVLRRQAEVMPAAVEIIVVTQSSMPATDHSRLQQLGGDIPTVVVTCRDGAMRWRFLEAAASRVVGDIVVVVEDDAIPEADDWLPTMAALALDPAIGAVSAMFRDHAHTGHSPADPLFSIAGAVLPGCVAMRRESFIRCTGLLDDGSGTTLPRLLEARGLICITAHYAAFRRWTERARVHNPRRSATQPRSNDRREGHHFETLSTTLRD